VSAAVSVEVGRLEKVEAKEAQERPALLSSGAAEPRDRRTALAFMLASAVLFLIAAPVAQRQLAPVWAFIPSYQSALVVSDLVTAMFLYGQFGITRSRAILMLASGYLFTACMAVAHALTFPGLFAPAGLLHAGPQSTAWLYMFWHGGFPLLVIAYACARDEDKVLSRGRSAAAIAWIIAAVLVVTVACTLVATAGHDALPVIMQGNDKTPSNLAVVSIVWLLSFVAIYALWRRRPHSALDLWLIVVMGAWLFDIALSAVLNAGRFDLGFYIGRVYGLLAATFVLGALLIENSRLYGLAVKERRRAERRASDLETLAAVDFLTGIYNRRHFETTARAELARCQRYMRPLSLLMIDIDHFKAINDRLGHAAGDRVLQNVAALCRTEKRDSDVVARIGGEEFAVMLPETAETAAVQFAERLRQQIAVSSPTFYGEKVAVTISVGISGASIRTSGIQALLRQADQALYEAKRSGRNRVVLWRRHHPADSPCEAAE
jgi:diguanylate cyclase (GGDEF)-like protein